MTELYNAFVNRQLMRPEDGIVLTNENVSSRAIRNALASLSRRMRPRDIFIFSFTGHGDTHRLATYNVGIDVTTKQLRRLLQMIPAETLFINLDSCMSGSFAQSVGRLSGRKKIVGVFSSRANELSFDTFVYSPIGPNEYVLRPRIGYYLFRAVHELGINGVVTTSTLTDFLQARYAEGDAERTYGQHLVTTGPDVVLWRAHPWNRTRH